MRTVAPPVSIRDDALAVIAARRPGDHSSQDALREIGVEDLADLLTALEAAFGIEIDADEVLPDGTVASLIDLVEAKAAGPRLIHWDDERARRALPLYRPAPAPADFAAWNAAHPPRPAAPPAPVAVPSDKAWDTACALFEQERRLRRMILALSLGLAVGSAIALGVVLVLAGLI